jgi:tRNA A-37 threonylcarbamoyl transferase component Bud32/tetratricopeptide (TPR) repeat protein
VDRPDISFEKGETYKDMGLLREAVAEFEKALGEESLKYRAVRQIAACLMKLDLPDQAEKILLQSLIGADVPMVERLRIYADLADVHARQGRLESALERLIQIRSEDPDLIPDLTDRIEDLSTRIAEYSPSEASSSGNGGSKSTTGAKKAALSPASKTYSDPRRKSPRVKMSNPVQYSFDQDRWTQGYSSDLSVSGMFILTYEPIPVGSLVFLRFDLPESSEKEPVEIIGQAVRQQSQGSDEEGVLGMGVRFLSMEANQKENLASVVSDLYREEAQEVDEEVKIRFHCDKCGRILTSTEAASGKLGKCVCSHTMPVPFTYHNPSPENPLRGLVLAGCRIDGVIGKGSAATVYKGHHLTLDVPVAIKILNPVLKVQQTQMAQRFLKEARVIARMRHPNIVGVMHAGDEDGRSFIVMQYVAGHSLVEVLNEKRRLPVADFIRIALDVCKALQAAHESSIVHGDVKPANILLTPGGTAMLVDFGLVKDLSTFKEESPRGIALGTPLYMSPEQARGEYATDTRSDIYSLGAAMYHLLVGRPPFVGFTNIAVIRKHLQEKPIPPAEMSADIPESLSDIIAKTMEKKPADRYQSVEEIKQDLLKVSRDMAVEQFKPLYRKLAKKKSISED